MRRVVALLVSTVVLAACGSSSLTASKGSPSPVLTHASPTPATSPIPPVRYDPATFPKLTRTYGLLVSRAPTGSPYFLHLVKPDASLADSVSVQWSDLAISCTGGTDAVNIPRPVSASDGHVYFREGSAIKMLVPPSTKVDVTTVPDSPTEVSMFSVRPDDQKIAVVVVDTSSPTTITTRLYVEDLFGGGHHADIFRASAAKSGAPTILWPVGWHQGNLVLAVAAACGSRNDLTEWHVSSPVTAARVATIKGNNCRMSVSPSPAGVACEQASGPTTLYDWGGKVLGVTGPGTDLEVPSTGLSPAGQSIYFSGAGHTRMFQLGPGPYATDPKHEACGWIDEDHLLSTDAVIQFPAETPGNVQVSAIATQLPQSALPDPSTPQTSGCAGRFPGGL